MDRLAQFVIGGWLLAAVGTFIANSTVEEGQQGGMREWAITLVMMAAVAAVVYLVVRGKTTSTTALVLAILAVVTLVVFWAGLTPIFAAAALAIALPTSGTPAGDTPPTPRSGSATAALVLSAIALLVWVVVILIG